MKSIESDHQIALFKWIRFNERKHPALKWVHHVPNGGQRSKTTAARLKAEGVKAGIPDICIPYGSHGYHSLYIEMKAPKGRLTDNQKAFKEYAESNNIKFVVCYHWEEAKEEIEEYLVL